MRVSSEYKLKRCILIMTSLRELERTSLKAQQPVKLFLKPKFRIKGVVFFSFKLKEIWR